MSIRLLVLLVASSAVVAGCITTSTTPGEGDVPLPATGALYALDCDLSNWADRCTVRASPNESPAKTEIDLAINPTDPLNVFVASKDLDPVASNCVWSVGQVTKDGGRTWETVYVGGTAEEGQTPGHPLYGWECITDPIMVFDAAGTLYYPLQAYNVASGGPGCLQDPVNALVPLSPLGGCGSAFFLAVSHDGGATFPTEDIIPMALGDGGLVFHDYPRMVVNPRTQTVSTVWNAVGSAGINPYVVSTRDGGASVDPPAIVAAPGSPRGTAFASGFAATSDGDVHMTVWLGGGATRTAYLATSTDDAASFGGFLPIVEVVTIDCPLPNTEFRCGTSVELAADTSGGAHDGRLYAVWDDGRNGHADIYSVASDDGGATWSEPVRVNQDSTSNAQWMARAKVGPDGTVHVLYMDRQFDPADRLYDLTYAWSTDGGATWGNQRVTTQSSDGDLGVHQNGFPFIGDYNGLDAVGDHVWLGFPQTVTGRAEISMAHLVRAPGGA